MHPDTGLCFKHFPEKKRWAEAKASCKSMGYENGDLASIPDEKTKNLLSTITTEKAWIGIYLKTDFLFETVLSPYCRPLALC